MLEEMTKCLIQEEQEVLFRIELLFIVTSNSLSEYLYKTQYTGKLHIYNSFLNYIS